MINHLLQEENAMCQVKTPCFKNKTLGQDNPDRVTPILRLTFYQAAIHMIIKIYHGHFFQL